MEKIDTDYKQRNLKIQAKVVKPFNRDVAYLLIFVIREIEFFKYTRALVQMKNQSASFKVKEVFQ